MRLRPAFLLSFILVSGLAAAPALAVTCGGVSCDDGNACTIDVCDPDLLTCSHTPVNCDDSNPCTADSCDPKLGCQHPPADGLACDDHSAATCNDHCEAGHCVGGTTCDDGNPCTVDTCIDTLGCRYSPAPDGAACDDGLPQTCGDHCAAGSCVFSSLCACPTSCDDGDPCTIDGCDLQGVCFHTYKTCEDDNPCTYDVCQSSTGNCLNDGGPYNRLPCTVGTCMVGTCEGGQCIDAQYDFSKDSDFDGHFDVACGGDDCNDHDHNVWHAVSEVANLQASSLSPTGITWDSQAASAGSGTTYDVASGLIPGSGGGYQSPACLSSAGGPSYDDGRPAPLQNQAYWYLVRARNSCGTGDYGPGSHGAPRSITACP